MKRSQIKLVAMFVMLIVVSAFALTTTVPTDLNVQGNLTVRTITLPANAVTDASVVSGAKIQATKLQHIYSPTLAQGSGTTVAAQTQTVKAIVGSTATVIVAEAGAIVPAIGTDTCAIDVKKNGTTILSAPISLTSSQTARQLVTGTISIPGAVVGDVFEVTITPTHSTGTLAQGVFVQLQIYEDAQ